MSYRSVSKKYGVFYDSVRTLYHRYVVSGWSGLQPHYERCGKVMPTHSDFRYRSTCWLKRLHPQWGAAFILVQLKQRYPFLVFPTVRTVQRWFAVEGLNVLHTRLPQNKQEKASEVHQILQVDAKENLHLADGSSACWLSIVDEKSGALLDALLFPPR